MAALIERIMMRCVRPHQAWWSVHPDDRLTAMCACGGELEADLGEYAKTLPYVPFVRTVPEVKK